MKDLLKIYRRYILTAVLISIITVLFNFILLIVFLLCHFSYKTADYYWEWRTPSLADALTRQPDGSYTLPEEASDRLDSDYAFAMLIDQEGQVIWSRNLPEDIPLSYSLTDVASFTRWYLKDYPVKVWVHPDGLFVTATPRDSLWKHGIEFDLSFIEAFPYSLLAVLFCNLLLIFLLALLFGHRFYTSLKPLVNGIEHLNNQEPLELPEQGIISGLAKKLNQTSLILSRQKHALEKRDNARANWIAGVSHDIRTPLSLIMGHADSLERNPDLKEAEQREAAAIKDNSLHIKKLIEDLNLTSKLEYNSYPLRLEQYFPAALIRDLAAFYMNHGLAEPYEIQLEIDPLLERISLTGDRELLLRAFRNLTDNSIRHNPQGCTIRIHACFQENQVRLCFSDTGKGIPIQVIKALYRYDTQTAAPALSASEETSGPHVMGLRVVKQIIDAHHGQIEFELQRDICHRVIIKLN